MRITVLFLSLFFLTITAQSDVSCPGNITFASETDLEIASEDFVRVTLRGVGLRTKFFVRAFYGALYLEEPLLTDDDIVTSDTVKVFTLHALRNITRAQIETQWNKEFNSLCSNQCDELRPFHEQFLSYAQDAKTNQRLTTVFLKDRVEFIADGNTDFEPIQSRAYGNLLLKALVGPKPANPGFKESVLGRGSIICR